MFSSRPDSGWVLFIRLRAAVGKCSSVDERQTQKQPNTKIKNKGLWSGQLPHLSSPQHRTFPSCHLWQHGRHTTITGPTQHGAHTTVTGPTQHGTHTTVTRPTQHRTHTQPSLVPHNTGHTRPSLIPHNTAHPHNRQTSESGSKGELWLWRCPPCHLGCSLPAP